MGTLRNKLATLILSFPRIAGVLDGLAVAAVYRMGRREHEEYQLERLRQILKYAYENVPYWRKLFDSLRFRPDEISILRDLERLPIFTKDIIREQESEFYAANWNRYPYLETTTSGSTGIPLRIIIDKSSRRRRDLFSCYALKFYGLDNMNKFANFWSTPTMKNIGTQINLEYFRDDLGALCKLIRQKFRYIGGPLNRLVALSEYLERNYEDLFLGFVQSGSEYLSPSTKEHLEKIFKCPVYNKYGSAEFGLIGFDCQVHEGFHIDPVNILIEIVDDEGRWIEDERIGRIVITSFDNKLTPFIRYDLGDVGKWVKEPCRCGLATPRLIFEGRDLYFLKLPGGRKYSVLGIFRSFFQYFHKYIKQLQVIQEAVDRITLRIIPSSLYEPRHDINFIRVVLNEINSREPITVNVQKASFIPRLPSGRDQLFISKI